MMLEDLYRLLKSGHVQAQGVLDTISVPLLVLDTSFRVITANNAFVQTFKVARDDVLETPLFTLGNGQWDIPDLKLLFEAVIPKSAGILGYEVTHDFPSIGKRTFLIDARRLVHPDNNSTNILVQFEDVTEKHRLDAERDFVISETRHRLKNVFAVVRAIAYQTDTEGKSAEQYRDTVVGRIDAATKAQELSLSVQNTAFADLLEKAVNVAGLDRFRIVAGPAAVLPHSRVLPVSMMYHELMTNALKYGALSAPAGMVHINWTVETLDNGKDAIVCEWREQDGPPCHEPLRRGYGTSLIEGTANYMGGRAQLKFDPMGLVAVITVPL